MTLPTLPTRTASFVAGDGLVSQVWYTFLYNLWNVLGGASGLAKTGVVYFDGQGLVATQALAANFGSQNPVGTTSSTLVMMGLASGLSNTFSVQTSSNVLITVCGEVANSTGTHGATVSLRYDNSTAPAHGSTVTGNEIGVQTVSNVNAAAKIPFSIIGLVQLDPGSTYWIDVALSANGGGTATVTDVSTTYLTTLFLPIPA